jgi:hypothetical protein
MSCGIRALHPVRSTCESLRRTYVKMTRSTSRCSICQTSHYQQCHGILPFELLHATQPIVPFDLVEAAFFVEGFYSGMTTTELLALRILQLQMHPKDIECAAATL